MFERFVENARRAVFFARYEASSLHSAWIESEHMLLGLLREDPLLKNTLSHQVREDIRQQIMGSAPRVIEETTTSVDLPLSGEVKRSLAYAAEEAERLGHSEMHCGHLVLGLLRNETCGAARILNEHAVQLEGFRAVVDKSIVRRVPRRGFRAEAFGQTHAPPASTRVPIRAPRAPTLFPVVETLHALVGAADSLYNWSDPEAEKHVHRERWTRKQALGHLVDWSTAHHRWFAMALTQGHLSESDYPSEDQADAQGYNELEWADLVNIWESLNQLILHILLRVPEEKLAMSCRIGNTEAIPLFTLVANYWQYSSVLMKQILSAN